MSYDFDELDDYETDLGRVVVNHVEYSVKECETRDRSPFGSSTYDVCWEFTPLVIDRDGFVPPSVREVLSHLRDNEFTYGQLFASLNEHCLKSVGGPLTHCELKWNTKRKCFVLVTDKY